MHFSLLLYCAALLLHAMTNQSLISAEVESGASFSNDLAHAHEDATSAAKSTHHCPTNRGNLYSAPKVSDVHADTVNKVEEEDMIVDTATVLQYSEMVEIPAGTYLVGNDKAFEQTKLDSESRSQSVTLNKPFYLDKFEVSNAAFQRFVHTAKYRTETEQFGTSFVLYNMLSEKVMSEVQQAVAAAQWWVLVHNATWRHPEGLDSSINKPSLVDSNCRMKDCSSKTTHSKHEIDPLRGGRLLHPVAHVSWNDASAYCAWLGKRLPTEIEWEIACRGGLHDRLFPWGNAEVPGGNPRMNIWQGVFPHTNLRDDGYHSTAPIDAFGEQNKFGLYNMVGNVWEWVVDPWLPNKSMNTSIDQVALQDWQRKQADLWNITARESVQKVKKGGSFMCQKSYCYRYRCAARSENTADSSASNLGFRCASSYLV